MTGIWNSESEDALLESSEGLPMIESFQDWFFSLGRDYGVNPWIFGGIYVGAIPFFLLSVAWLVRRARAGRSFVIPTLCAGFCFVSGYLYLAIAGRNIPVWVWIFLGVLVVYGAVSTIRDTRRKIAENPGAQVDAGHGTEVMKGSPDE